MHCGISIRGLLPDIGKNSSHIVGLLERGIAVRQGQRFLRMELPRILATPPDVLSPRMVRVIEELASDWRRLDERIKGVVRRDRGACQTRRRMRTPDERARHRTDHRAAMVAAIGTGEAFSKGRDFAAWLGLIPKQISTGDRTILGKISKRGNRYLPFCSCKPRGWC